MNAFTHEINLNRENITWKPIFVGTLIALSLEVLLNFLGIGLGLASLDMSASSLFKTGVGSIIWLSLTGIFAMAVAGFITGKVSFINCARTRALHGVLVWSLALLITVMSTMTVSGAIIGGPSNVVKSSIATVGQKTIPATSQFTNADTPQSAASDETINNQTTNEATSNLGKASMAIFVAFLLSLIASTIGAICGRSKSV